MHTGFIVRSLREIDLSQPFEMFLFCFICFVSSLLLHLVVHQFVSTETSKHDLSLVERFGANTFSVIYIFI